MFTAPFLKREFSYLLEVTVVVAKDLPARISVLRESSAFGQRNCILPVIRESRSRGNGTAVDREWQCWSAPSVALSSRLSGFFVN